MTWQVLLRRRALSIRRVLSEFTCEPPQLPRVLRPKPEATSRPFVDPQQRQRTGAPESNHAELFRPGAHHLGNIEHWLVRVRGPAVLVEATSFGRDDEHIAGT